MAGLSNGFRNGVFISVNHDVFFVRNHVFCHDPFFFRRHCSPFFAFSFGFGFPYYASYYAPYPWWWDPYYPYYGGVYVGYYPAAYPYAYYPPPNYVYGDSYVQNDAAQPAAESQPAAEEAPSRPAEAESQTAQGERGRITPIPRSEMVEQDRAGAPEAGSAAREALSGLAEFRSGAYADGSESLFAAAQAQPRSAVVKVYLAESLFAIGEYGYAAEYLRQALEARPDLASRVFDPSRLYSPTPEGEKDFADHFAQLSERARLFPYDQDALLVLGFLQLNASRLEEAAATLTALRDTAVRPQDQALASRLLVEAKVRNGALPEAAQEADVLLVARGAPEEDPLGEMLAAALD